jgi:hypothetical protein
LRPNVSTIIIIKKTSQTPFRLDRSDANYCCEPILTFAKTKVDIKAKNCTIMWSNQVNIHADKKTCQPY